MENGIINIPWQLTFQSRSVAEPQYWHKRPENNKTEKTIERWIWDVAQVWVQGCGCSNLIKTVIGEAAGKEWREVKEKEKQKFNRCKQLHEAVERKKLSIQVIWFQTNSWSLVSALLGKICLGGLLVLNLDPDHWILFKTFQGLKQLFLPLISLQIT